MIPRGTLSAAISRPGSLPCRLAAAAWLPALAAIASAQVAINEVHYSPDPKTAKLEFVELFNSGGTAIDLTGWRLAGGDFTFPTGTVLDASGYLLVCQDLGAMATTWFPATSSETAVSYDFSTATGSQNPGTTLAGQDNWTQPAGGAQLTVRNEPTLPGISGNRGYSSTTTAIASRKNNGSFSYAIPSNATSLRLAITGRIKNNATTSLGPGIDANGNGVISHLDTLGEYGFEFGFSNNAWFIRQAAQGNTATSPNLGFNSSGRVWYMELRVDLTGNGGDGSGSLFVQQLSDTSSNPVVDSLKPVATLQNVNLGLTRMSANGGNSQPFSWNGMFVGIGYGHLDGITIAHAALAGAPEHPLMYQMAGTLSNEGESLTLLDASGAVVDSVSYRPEFPWPVSAGAGGGSMQLVHPSLDNDLGGSWRAGAPTPGARNAVYTENAPPQIRQVSHFPAQPSSSQPVVISAKATDPDGVAGMQLFYQIVGPGNYIPAFLPHPHATLLATPNAPLAPNPAFEDPVSWVQLAMNDAGHSGDAVAGDSIFSVSIPAHANRSLVRYRIAATDTLANAIRVPYHDDPSLNFACFVYDGIPDWKATTRSVHPEGAGHVHPASVLNSLPVHTLITRNADLLHCYAYSALGNSSWQIPKSNTEARSAFNWEAAVVHDGIVYDHIRYRLRQSNDRYSGNGKRSMRFRFNDGHRFQTRDERGDKLPYKWSKLNTAKMSRFGGANEYGIREMINAKLWRMFGVEVPMYYHGHMRVIDGFEEAPGGADGQHQGDFFGLALFYEDFAGPFLDNRKLPKGNIYKWKDGVTNPADLQQYQARDGVADYADFNNIRNQLRPERDDAWLNAHVDYPQWYRYHAICEAIRHYDFGTTTSHLKNRGWYFQPAIGSPLGRLRHIPHDHDASWYVGYHDGLSVGIGIDFAKQAIFGYDGTTGKSAFTREYRNVLRECRDLLWREETIHDMLARITSDIAEFSLADRDRWLGAPSAAGYESSMPPVEDQLPVLKSFAFTADKVDGVTLPGGRAAYLERLAADPLIPAKPSISYGGPPGFPVNAITLETSPYSGTSPNPFGAIQWRFAQITDPAAPAHNPAAPATYEITAAWDSGALPLFENQVTVPLSEVRPGLTYRARVRHMDITGRWSHWSDPLQFTSGLPDVSIYQQSLVVSELMYNPHGGNQDIEFIELLNIGPHQLDLSPLRFTKGIDFDFAGSSITTLAPNARVLVVARRDVFESIHGTGLPVAGEYWANDENNLSNGGETLKLSYGAGIGVIEFDYDDTAPWPTSPDGGGASLVLIDPWSSPDHALAASWRASHSYGGNPGSSDARTFTGDPSADLDGDGIPALLEFVLGGADDIPGDHGNLPAFDGISVGGQSYPALRYARPADIEGVRETLQVSPNLLDWTDVPFVNEATGLPGPDGRVPVLLRSSVPQSGSDRQFLRLKAMVYP
jgi:hypothetical protein